MSSDDQASVVAEPMVETVRRRKQQKKKRPKRQPRYHVILWNDEEHSYAYVISMLKDLFGFTSEQGFQTAEEVDSRGRAVVMTTTKELAELKRDQIHAYGKDDIVDGCKGSMSASIEPEI